MASGLKTFLWAAAAVAMVPTIMSGGGLIWTALKVGTALFAASRAWKSHKENQAIAAYENAPQNDVVYSSGLSRQQERALAIARMQGDEVQDQGTYWQDRARAASQETTRY